MFAHVVKRSMSAKRPLADVVFVDGVRTPFQTSGTGYSSLMAYDLGRMAIEGLVQRTGVPKSSVDAVVMGTVIQEAKTSNVARECSMGAGLPLGTVAYTETMACISSNRAAASGVELIRGGQADLVVVGGTETMSDVPLRVSRKLRKRLIGVQKVRKGGPLAIAKHMLSGLSASEVFALEMPAIAEFSTGEVMGHSADRLAAKFGVTRDEQDAYALRSHHAAAAAAAAGKLWDVLSVSPAPKFDVIDSDNGVRGDMQAERIAKLKPAFIKPHGTVTAASSSFLSDGASAAIVTTPERAAELGLAPKAFLRDYIWVAQDPKEELLLGPAYAIARLLHRNNMTLADFDVVEIHEAFAAQVLANLRALESEEFCRQSANVPATVGAVNMDRLNTLGGSLSLGHPFGATGVRLISTAANRLIQEDGKLALIASCAAGGLGHAMIVERFDSKSTKSKSKSK
jgi:acetyl-CoA acyltransferase